MVTDEERREVARRLRELDEEENYKVIDFIWAIIATCNEHISVPAYLADLIEPGCDRDALLALADEMEQETGSVCGVCMGKSARRIREALGVEHAES